MAEVEDSAETERNMLTGAWLDEAEEEDMVLIVFFCVVVELVVSRTERGECRL